MLSLHHVSCSSHISTSTRNLFELPLLRELLIQALQLLHEVLASLHDRLLAADLAVGLHAQLEGREQRVRDLVGGVDDVRRLDELGAQQVGEGVVFFVEGEHGGVWDALCTSVGFSSFAEWDTHESLALP